MLPVLAHAQEPIDTGEEEESMADDYVEQGTLEIGGAIGGSITDDTKTFAASPSVGYFIVDRVELSAIVTFEYTRVEDEDTGSSKSTKAGLLVLEPSYHHPISDNVLAVGGLGVGVGYDGDNADFEIVPSIGLDILTSRSNAITPTIRVPIVIGEESGTDGGLETSVGVAFDVGITTTW